MLEEARNLGFLGPGPVGPHIEHAAGFATAIESTGNGPPREAADLGSGGGVPGLALALRFADCRWILIESGMRRAAFLREAVARLGLAGRVSVVEARAEVVGRNSQWRNRLELVTARGFGPPAVVAECGAPLLMAGGRVVVSEPPGGRSPRWPPDAVAVLGLAVGPTVTTEGASYQVLRQVTACPDRYPRRVGMPAKRPLF